MLEWVEEVAALTKPDRVEWCDGSDAEWDRLTQAMVDGGTFTRLNPEIRPNSFLARSDPSDVARVEDRTFICSLREQDAGPTNNWQEPSEMRETLKGLFDGSMRGRTMYVIPFSMGPLGSHIAELGVELTDSPYVVVNMRIMTRMGQAALDLIGEDGDFVPALHSVGYPLVDAEGNAARTWPGRATTPSTSCTSRSRARSGRTVPATAATRCWARSASPADRLGDGPRRGLDGEHMLILKLTAPDGDVKYLTAAFPSACGKTNLAMLEPTVPGWKVETVGDDIAWMRFGEDGRLYAINPRRVSSASPGHRHEDQRQRGQDAVGQLDLHQRCTHRRRRHLVGGSDRRAPAHLIDWKGRDWTPTPTSRAATRTHGSPHPAAQCPSIADNWEDPAGVPISAILFGGRRATNVPLVNEARDWAHGVFIGATVSSEMTAAAVGGMGQLRRDPFAMLPFCGYNMADYWGHWLKIGEKADPEKLPEGLPGQLVPQGRGRQVHLARFRRELPGSGVDHRAGRGPHRRRADRDRRQAEGRRPVHRWSGPRAGSAGGTVRGGPGELAGGVRPHRGVLPEVR